MCDVVAESISCKAQGLECAASKLVITRCMTAAPTMQKVPWAPAAPATEKPVETASVPVTISRIVSKWVCNEAKGVGNPEPAMKASSDGSQQGCHQELTDYSCQRNPIPA